MLRQLVERGQEDKDKETILAWADLKLTDIITSSQQQVAKSLKGPGGRYIGATLIVGVECEEVDEGACEVPSPSALDVPAMAAATRIFWNLGMPKREACKAIAMIVSRSISEEVGDGLRFWTRYQCEFLYQLNWLSGLIRRWSFVVKSRHLQNLKRKKEEEEYIQMFLQRHQENMQQVRQADPEVEQEQLQQMQKEMAMFENGMKLVDAFCSREDPKVCQLDTTQVMVSTYKR